jgi:hypothetical protein
MNVTPSFEINGEDASQENVLQVIKSHFKEMTDEIGGELAVKLELVFSNMPLTTI